MLCCETSPCFSTSPLRPPGQRLPHPPFQRNQPGGSNTERAFAFSKKRFQGTAVLSSQETLFGVWLLEIVRHRPGRVSPPPTTRAQRVIPECSPARGRRGEGRGGGRGRSVLGTWGRWVILSAMLAWRPPLCGSHVQGHSRRCPLSLPLPHGAHSLARLPGNSDSVPARPLDSGRTLPAVY